MLESIKKGIPSAFATGDYVLVLLICKTILAIKGDPNLSEAAAYFTVFYSIMCHCFSYAITDAQGAAGSKFIGRGDYDKAFMTLKQCLVISGIFFITLTVIPGLFAGKILGIFGADKKIMPLTQELILWSLPGIYVRLLNDCFKTFIQNQGFISELGFSTMKPLAIVPFLSYIILVHFKLRASSFGIIILIYELLMIIVCSSYFSSDIDSSKLDSGDLKLDVGLKYLVNETLKTLQWLGQRLLFMMGST